MSIDKSIDSFEDSVASFVIAVDKFAEIVIGVNQQFSKLQATPPKDVRVNAVEEAKRLLADDCHHDIWDMRQCLKAFVKYYETGLAERYTLIDKLLKNGKGLLDSSPDYNQLLLFIDETLKDLKQLKDHL